MVLVGWKMLLGMRFWYTELSMYTVISLTNFQVNKFFSGEFRKLIRSLGQVLWTDSLCQQSGL